MVPWADPALPRGLLPWLERPLAAVRRELQVL
jgi:hypothetical protein